MGKTTELTSDECAVLAALDPEYQYVVAIVPGMAKIGDWAAADALAGLKRRGYVKFEGRGRTKSVYTTPEGATAREAL